MTIDDDINDLEENELKKQIEKIDKSLSNLHQLEQSVNLDLKKPLEKSVDVKNQYFTRTPQNQFRQPHLKSETSLVSDKWSNVKNMSISVQQESRLETKTSGNMSPDAK